MSATISITQQDLFLTLWTFITGVIPGAAQPDPNVKPEVEVVQGLDNKVPPPPGPHIVVTVMFFNRLATNIRSYNDPAVADPDTEDGGTEAIQQNAACHVQIDCYGPDSQDWAIMLTTLLRDPYGCDALAPNVSPLHADDPKQIPLVDSEAQYEQRWLVEAVLQYNPIVTVPMQFFDEAVVSPIVNVEVTYP